jgi:hypothetical protein
LRIGASLALRNQNHNEVNAAAHTSGNEPRE